VLIVLGILYEDDTDCVGGVFVLITIVCSDEHPLKTLSLIDVTFSPISTFCNFVQFLNKPSLTSDRLFGKITFVNSVHPWKADSPIVFILSCKTMVDSDLHELNAEEPIALTVDGIYTDVKLEHPEKAD
jgi:hypothetical protein